MRVFVPAPVRVGNYELTLDQKGIRIARIGDETPLVVTPVLTFSITEVGGQLTLFHIERIIAIAGGAAEFHGYTTQYLSLYGRIAASPSVPSGLLVTYRVENASEDMQLRTAAHLMLTGEADPRWMVPGFFYGNNRPPGCTRVHPTYSEINRDLRRLISNFWAIRSDRAAIPLVCAWTYGAFAWVATDGIFGHSRENPDGVGMTGLQFGSEEGQPTLAVEFPYREVPVKFSFCHEDKIEPEETFVMLPKVTPLSLEFELGFGQPDLHAYAEILRQLYYKMEKRHELNENVNGEAAEHLAHTGMLRWHFDGRQAALYESASFDRHFGRKGGYTDRTHMHAGWLSGALPAYGLLWAGRESMHVDSINAGTSVLNKFTSQVSPSGTIFPVWTEENGWACSFGPEEGTAHSRTVAEAILFLIRAVALEIKNDTNHVQWVDAAVSSLNYAMGAQREDGCFPSYYDLTTGRPTNYEGCGGLPWMAALAAGCALLQKPHYREVATRAGDYYSAFIRNATLYGTVEDLPSVPTSDDCHWALIAYITLYELDRDSKWLGLARKAADLALSWRFAYNVAFPKDSLLGIHGINTRGGDITSVASPGVGCQGLISYREMLMLALFTGDDYYRRRAEDARSFAHQLVVRADGQFNAREGMVAGLLFHTDWWQPKGMMLSLSNVMAAGLIKYSDMTHRSLRVTAKAVEDALEGEQVDFGEERVLYSDMEVESSAKPDAALTSGGLYEALGYAKRQSGSGEDHPALRAVSAVSGSGRPSPTPAQDRGRADDVSKVTERVGSLLGLSMGGSDRPTRSPGLSGDQIPASALSKSEPAPFSSVPLSAPRPADEPREAKGTEEVEIKYKIF